MYDFTNTEWGDLPHDIGGQAALNDLNRKIFGMFKGFPNEDAAWQDMRQSEFGAALFEALMEFDEWEFNGTAKEEE